LFFLARGWRRAGVLPSGRSFGGGCGSGLQKKFSMARPLIGGATRGQMKGVRTPQEKVTLVGKGTAT